VLLGPIERDARGPRSPLAALGLGADQQHCLAAARGDLARRVREHALNGAAGDRPPRRLSARAAEAFAQQRRGIRIMPEPVRHADRVERPQQRAAARIVGGRSAASAISASGSRASRGSSPRRFTWPQPISTGVRGSTD